jgi:hypothetical protein
MIDIRILTTRLNAISFCCSGAVAAWKLARGGGFLDDQCEGGGEATRCGKLGKMVCVSQDVYANAKFVLTTG